MLALKEKVNGIIVIHKKTTHTKPNSQGIWMTDYTIGAINKTTMLMRDYFGDVEQLQCVIEKTEDSLTITIVK